MGFDIYKYAENIDADFIDTEHNVYKVQEYNRAIRNGIPTHGIEIQDFEGNCIGIAKKNEEEEGDCCVCKK